ncbi:rfaE_dom_I, bifunctional protein RfaE, domain I [uncultured Caudovirales phage]|uniref:RfaE_dom_I, bifunctional protein RfaE, domain I n=1 Tax=uncultured Caudovirales phage TaxID=2100421 RepID=A0A6J5LM07_9CAUD|nr:rfaE_dom_I, bifunctional protein RfaE, domain I [uncultured Caudovirales phage]
MEKVRPVLVIGDSCTDITYQVDNSRKNPEYPEVPLLKVVGDPVVSMGMAHKVARGLQQLKLEVLAEMPPPILETKARYVDRTGHPIVRIDSVRPFRTELGKLSREKLNTTCNNITADNISAVVISDYNKGFISTEDIISIIDICVRCNVPVFLDTKKPNLRDFSGAIIKINSKEYTAATDLPNISANMVVTLGEQGAMHPDPKVGLLPSYKPEHVYDNPNPCGAGDLYLVGLVYGFLKTNDIRESMKYASVLAGMHVYGEWGVNPNYLEQEKKRYDEINGYC